MLSNPWLWVAGLLVAALCLFRRRRLRALHGAAAWCPPSLRGDAPDLSSDYDVIVVGAGVTGPAVAVGLARQGRRVLVLEADLSRPDRVVGEVIMPGGQRSLAKLDIAGAKPDAADVASRMWGMTVFYKDTTLSLPFPDDRKAVAFEHGDFVMGLRREMRAAAAALDATAAAGVPGGSITIVEAAVKSLIADPTGSVVHGVNYAPRRQDGPGFEDEQQAATARLVVLADGVNSRFTNVVSTARLDVPAPAWIARRVFTSLVKRMPADAPDAGSDAASAEATRIETAGRQCQQKRHIVMFDAEVPELDRSFIHFAASGPTPAIWYPLRGASGTGWRLGSTYFGEAPAGLFSAVQGFSEHILPLLPPALQSACRVLMEAWAQKSPSPAPATAQSLSDPRPGRLCLAPQSMRIGPVFPTHRGVAIVGDCGETRSPVTGSGMSAALADVVSLVESLGQVSPAAFAAARPMAGGAANTASHEWVAVASSSVHAAVRKHCRTVPSRFAGCTCFGQLLLQAMEGPFCLRDALVRTLEADKCAALWTMGFLGCLHTSVFEYFSYVAYLLGYTLYNEVWNRKEGSIGKRVADLGTAGGIAVFLALRATYRELVSLWWFADPSIWC